MRDIGPTERPATVTQRTAPQTPAHPTTAPHAPPPAPSSAPAVELASSLSGLLETGTVEGKIAGFDRLGRVILQTEIGSFIMTGAPKAQIGEQVLLQLMGVAAGLRAQILRLGETILTPAVQVILDAIPKSGFEPGKQPAIPSGMISDRGPRSNPAATEPTALEPGTLVGRSFSAKLIAEPSQHAPPASAGAQGQPVSASHPPRLPPGSQYLFRVREVLLPSPHPPESATAPSLPLTPGAVIVGVIGTPQQGRTLWHTSLGTLAIDLAEPLPAGSRIVAELGDLGAPKAATQPPAETAREAVQRLSRDWPALAQALAALKRQEGDFYRKFLAQAVPQADARLGVKALHFFTALAAGDAGQWLRPEAARLLEQGGRGDLVQRLTDDFAKLARFNTERAEGDWRLMFLPVFDGTELRHSSFFYRSQRHKEGETEREVRFILALELDQGQLHLDGLVKAKRFDLILRSERALPANWQNDIAEIFRGALGLGGLTGEIQFQSGHRALPIPLADPAAEATKAGLSV